MNPFKLVFFTVIIFALNVSLFNQALAETKAPLRIGLVLDKGGKDDKSFNSAAYAGAKKAEKELGIELKYVEATDNNSIENLHRNFSQKKYDLIIGIGFAQVDAVKKVAKLFPEIKFAIVDGEINEKNVKSILFEEHEGSYVVGYAAGMKTKTNVIGFLGGMDIPLIRRFQKGFEAGAKAAQPKSRILVNYIGATGEAWNNPAKAKELSLSMISQKADVIFHAAGASGSGLFDAASDKKIFAIGVDSNQNWMKPGIVLTSMLKKVDVAVFDVIKSIKNNEFKGGINRFGVSSGGVDWALDEYNKSLWSEVEIKKISQVKDDISHGKITVPDYYKTK
jgi:basic membrane protein A